MDIVIIAGLVLFVVWIIWRARRSLDEKGEGHE
jgi:hypothetical protein